MDRKPTSTTSNTGQKTAGDSFGLGPVHKSQDELMHMHPHELLEILDERHIDHKGCVEKGELVKLILDKCSK